MLTLPLQPDRCYLQVGELLDRLEQATLGGSPRPVVQRVLSDLIVYLRIHAARGNAAVLELEEFEAAYAAGRRDRAEPILILLREWCQRGAD